MNGLLERVKFLGGMGGAEQEPAPTYEGDPVPDGLLDMDPEPSPAVRDKPRNTRTVAAKPARAPRNGGKFVSKTQVQKDLADELDMWLKVIAATWSLNDEECSGALNATSSLIAADLAKLGARSDWIMDKFQTTSLLGDIAQAFLHAKPFIGAVWRHHGPGARARAQQEEEQYDHVPVVDPNQYGPWRPPLA